MHPIDFVNKVKELFNDAPIATESQVEFVEYTLENGTTINVDKYEVGGVVTLADGTFAPMGEHILADKSALIIAPTLNVGFLPHNENVISVFHVI
jgi:hypothetical protein